MFFNKKSKPVLGLDISSSAVKLLELTKTSKSYRVESYAAEGLPSNAVNEKSISDVEAVGEAIRRAVKRSGTKLNDVAVAIAGDAVITKTIQLDANLPDRELEERVLMQADQYIPFPMEEVRYDFEVIGISDRDPELLDVELVASRIENVDVRTQAVRAANLNPKIVDIEEFALSNACDLLRYQMPNLGVEATVAVIDFGATTSTFAVFSDNRVIYSRDFNFGGYQLTEDIMNTYGLSYEEAGKAKKLGGLPSNYEPEVLDPFMDDMTQQVNRALQYYLASSPDREQPQQIVICGGCANITGVDLVVKSKVNTNVIIGNPIGSMTLSSRAKSQKIEKDATALLIASGLALRSFD
ncbi:MAG: pilus assembly protein PilM [Gammaproteobacteria bacterium]|nr:pilus assembly protein PilM [Gammaproteobacteria bacterium]NNC97937.1 pilus assembly protein PilM [Gammaproteobacteria bacterium]NNM14265.1 pilus assembly protein PilM [Gammaproteobacteria bacterium]